MTRMRALPLFVLAALGACSPAPPPTEPHETPPPPPASVSASPSEAPSLTAPPPPSPKPVEARFASFSITGLEARVAALRIRAIEPALRACVDKAPGARGILVLKMGVDERGKPLKPSAEGTASAAIGACVLEAIGAITFDGPVQKDAAIRASAIVREQRDEGALPAMEGHEALILEDDASCVGLTSHPCPPHKMCMAPTRRPVRCPEGEGLPPKLKLHEANRHLMLSTSGGKTGQSGEDVILVEGAHQCALIRRTKAVMEGLPDIPGEVEVHLDVPCAKAKVVWAEADKQKLFTFRGPKGSPNQVHGVSRHWRLTTHARADVPTMIEGRWSGEDKRGDAAFNAVGSQIAKLAKEAGITLARYE